MQTLREYIQEAQAQKKAVGHFNFSNLEGLYAIARAAKTLGVPVIAGTSEGEEEAVGTKEAVALVHTMREDLGIAIFLNADHHYSFTTVKRAIDAGYDSVIFDGANLSLEENIKQSKQCVEYARASGRDVIVEVELGYIGQSSKLLDEIPKGVEMVTDPKDAIKLMTESGADMLAPAVGNFHGMLKHADKPRLNIECIKTLKEEVQVPMVLHGGSGEEADFASAIEAGICVVHVNTELRRAYTDALKTYLANNPEDIAPYKYGTNASLAMEHVVQEKLKIFNRLA
jgi:fructose-bisphosphate aldolase, class II